MEIVRDPLSLLKVYIVIFTMYNGNDACMHALKKRMSHAQYVMGRNCVMHGLIEHETKIKFKGRVVP
jgi:hypothetical protein